MTFEISGASNTIATTFGHLVNLADILTSDDSKLPNVSLAGQGKEFASILSKIILATHVPRNGDLIQSALKLNPSVEASARLLHTIFDVEEVNELVQVLQEEGQSLRNRDNQTAAATKIQKWWRGTFQRKKWLSMRKGFANLQNLYRKRLLTKERCMIERIQESELQFQGIYEEIVQNRMKAEQQFQDLLEAKKNPWQFQTRPTHFPQQDHTTSRQEVFQWTTRQEMAAIKIQIAVRKWLRRSRKRPIWLQSLMIPPSLTEDKIRRYQDEIELWQQNHQVPHMDPTELQELHHRAQLEFMSFNRRALESKRAEHMIMSKMAQSKTILSILETASTLEDYNPDNRTDFMSLSLPIAVKARLEHKAAMARLNMPRWQRILHDTDN